MSEKPYSSSIKSSSDLITTYEATRSGFLEMALERNKASSPYVDQAKILKSVASTTSHPEELVNIDSIKSALISAAGFSDKAKKYVIPESQDSVISKFIEKFLIPAGDYYVDELVYRFLLTKGDSIGGSLRNLTGKIAQKKVNNSIISALELFQFPFYWYSRKNDKWVAGDSNSAENEIAGLSWKNKSKDRTILFNYLVPTVGNNIDLCLINCPHSQTENNILPESFIALGELKGGIDPAGADEHWKTARTAFTRIRQAFSGIEHFPNTFFIGAAIEKNMAEEIWNQLQSNTLSNAANLTNSDQLSSIVTWLITL